MLLSTRVEAVSRDIIISRVCAKAASRMANAEERHWLRYVAAPMVNQSDLAFRLTAVQYGATATWTCVRKSDILMNRQMYHVDDLQDAEVRETVMRALHLGRSAPENIDSTTGCYAPQIVQLAGNDPDAFASAAKLLCDYADGFDINLGMQRPACAC